MKRQGRVGAGEKSEHETMLRQKGAPAETLTCPRLWYMRCFQQTTANR